MEKEKPDTPEWLKRETDIKNTINTIANNVFAERISTTNISLINFKSTKQQFEDYLILFIPDYSLEELSEDIDQKLKQLDTQGIRFLSNDFVRNKLRENASDKVAYDKHQLQMLSVAYQLGIITDNNLSVSTRLSSLEEIIAVSFDVHDLDEICMIKDEILAYKMPDAGGCYIPEAFLSYFVDPNEEDDDLDLLENL